MLFKAHYYAVHVDDFFFFLDALIECRGQMNNVLEIDALRRLYPVKSLNYM